VGGVHKQIPSMPKMSKVIGRKLRIIKIYNSVRKKKECKCKTWSHNYNI